MGPVPRRTGLASPPLYSHGDPRVCLVIHVRLDCVSSAYFQGTGIKPLMGLAQRAPKAAHMCRLRRRF